MLFARTRQFTLRLTHDLEITRRGGPPSEKRPHYSAILSRRRSHLSLQFCILRFHSIYWMITDLIVILSDTIHLRRFPERSHSEFPTTYVNHTQLLIRVLLLNKQILYWATESGQRMTTMHKPITPPKAGNHTLFRVFSLFCTTAREERPRAISHNLIHQWVSGGATWDLTASRRSRHHRHLEACPHLGSPRESALVIGNSARRCT